MRKRLFILLVLALPVVVNASAQSYVVTAVTGKAEIVMHNGTKRTVKLREQLSPTDVINMGYGASLELIDPESRKQYTLRTPGKSKLETMMADRRNSVLKLTGQYFDYLIAQVKGSKTVVSKRVSDPATVTREVAIDSMYVIERDSVPEVKPDTVVSVK